MAAGSIRLLETEPDLARFLAREDQEEAKRLAVPVRRLERGPLALDAFFRREGAFGAVILDGIFLGRLQLGNHLTMRLVGPGDVLAMIEGVGSMLITDWSVSVAQDTSVALLGHDFLLAARRWPWLAAGLHSRMGQQMQRAAVQLAICQLPRVEERLLALLWWLAEAWGRVTSVGTVVPLAMTHDVLGALIGARRPTVTLALGELSARGAIVRQDRGWLLVEPPPASTRPIENIDDPTVIGPGLGEWRDSETALREAREERVALLETVERLGQEHRASAAEVRRRLERMRRSREELAERRQASNIKPRQAPS